ncbi:extracellular solute-binding protein [Paenibacillus thalictri]|uniref:Extracellular solute-binding protein n=2 Tax=Paenibacillus thalictri TaxID=2527873 RepID=A0A4Q9DRC4_9BACL|nr:extracellular solute-binding protein [Paenibacillus thalictri]TBL76149.1 extracellular solute-binding protein [Paenibacillus thalictri]
MSAMLTIGVLAACSSNDQNAGAGTSASNNANNASAKKEPVTLRVEMFDRGNAPAGQSATNNFWTKWMQDSFGTPNNIKLEYVPVPRAQEVEKLNVLMASGGDAPDIVFTYDSNLVYKYVQQGGLADLGKALEDNGKNLKSFLGNETLEYGKFNNVQYAIPARRVNLGKYASFIRQDWLDALGMQPPKNTEEVYNFLKAVKEKDPGKVGKDLIPLGMALAPSSYEPIIWPFIKKNLTEEEKYTQRMQLGSRDYPLLTEGHKEALQFLNKLYNEGLMSTDFALDKDKKKLSQDVMTGKVGLFSEDTTNPLKATPGVFKVMQTNIKGAKMTPVDPFAGADGKHTKPVYMPAGMYIIVPKSSKNVNEAIKYLDFMAQKDNYFKIMNGDEGKNYKMENGIPVTLDNQETKDKFFSIGDFIIISNGQDLGNEEKNTQLDVKSLPPEFEKEGVAVRKIALTDTEPMLRFPRPIQSEVKYGTSLVDKYHEMLVKSVLAKPADFDKTYEQGLKDLMAAGGQEIATERKAAYQEMKAKK